MRYLDNKLLKGINPSEIVKVANEILGPNGIVWLIDEHIHENGYDYARELTIKEDVNGKWIVDDALSGGKLECVWNHYIEEFDELFDAIVYALGIRGDSNA